MIGAETYWSIVSNPPHIFAELTWSVVLDLLLIQPIRWAMRRHDTHHHPTDTRRQRRRKLKQELDSI